MGDDRLGQLQGNPDLFVRIAENALVVADEIREDYFRSTIDLAHAMRESFRGPDARYRIQRVETELPEPCAVAFIDGGLSRIDVGLAVPLIVRAGIFRVKQGERDLEKRETFDHFPLMLGQLRGGLKADGRYGDVVRELVELGAMVTALEDERFDDIRLLMLHGPLQFVSGVFFDHWFYPEDYEAMLGRDEREHVLRVLGQFAAWCKQCPLRGTERCDGDISDQHLPAVCMMAFLQHYIFRRAAEKDVLVCGTIERSFGRSITKHVVRTTLKARPEVFDRLLGILGMRTAGTTAQAEAILDATRYNDALLLGLSLEQGEFLEWYELDPKLKVKDARAELFPRVQSTFMRPTSAKYPMRIEAPLDYGEAQLDEIVRRCYDYSSLLPNYAFPIGLDIVDKYSAIPSWMTKAYRQLILAQYGRLLAGDYVEIADSEALKSLMLMSRGGERNRRERPGV